jgi:hypothetical protein
MKFYKQCWETVWYGNETPLVGSGLVLRSAAGMEIIYVTASKQGKQSYENDVDPPCNRDVSNREGTGGDQ